MLLAAAGWLVCDASAANILAARRVDIGAFQRKSGLALATYLRHNSRIQGLSNFFVMQV